MAWHVSDSLNVSEVSDVIPLLTPGFEVFGVCKGQFTMAELAEHFLRIVGPSEVIISVWSAKGNDIARVLELLSSDLITSIRWIVDPGFPNRRPTSYDQIISLFGIESLIAAKCHLKVLAIKNAKWNIVVRGSMNLLSYGMTESFDVSDSPEIMACVEAFAAAVAGGKLPERDRRKYKESPKRLSFGDSEHGGPLEYYSVRDEHGAL